VKYSDTSEDFQFEFDQVTRLLDLPYANPDEDVALTMKKIRVILEEKFPNDESWIKAVGDDIQSALDKLSSAESAMQKALDGLEYKC
jgi:hypothetical protein